MIPDKKFEEIERFLNSEMTEGEQTGFEKEIAQDRELAKTVALYKDLPNHLNNIQGDLDFNTKLQSTRDNYSQTSSNPTSWKWLVIGIFTIVVTGLIWKQFFSTDIDTSTNTEEVKEKKQTLPEGVPIASLWNDTEIPPAYITRNGAAVEADVETYQNAHQLYSKKEYIEALDLLGTITDKSNIYAETLLLKGVIQYELNEYDEAIKTYNDYIMLGAEPQDMVLWYQALAYIQVKQTDKAKYNLQRIVDNDYSKTEIAKTLLEKL